MGFATALFALAASGIVATWAWLGAAVQMPPSALGGGKLHCVSYAPFRGTQDPFGPDIPIDPRQIDEAHFAEVTREFLRMLRDRRALPSWERPNMLAKYFVSTKGTELSHQQPPAAAPRIAPK